MRSRLLQSFLFVLGFWWLAAAAYWSVSDPDVNLEALLRVQEMLPWAPIEIPQRINVLEAWAIQEQVLRFWSMPVILITLLAAGIGGGLVWSVAYLRNKERAERVKTFGEYRGVSLTLGSLPVPKTPPLQRVGLRATDQALQGLSPEELRVLADVLGLLAANQECFAGEHQPAGSLLQLTLKSAYRALKRSEHPGPAAIVVAASELGKITAWKKDEDGAWIRVRHENREAARLLAALPSWWALPEVERLSVLYAVKYRGRIDLLPEVKNPAVYRLARALIEARAASEPASVTPAETPGEETPAKAYEQRDPEVELYEVFEREIAMMPFQTIGLPKNIPAVGWKKGNRAFFLENRLTEHLIGKLRPELKAAYALSTEKVRVQKLTATLLKVFDEKGWLVREHESMSMPAHEALWVIQAGKLEFSRVLILELPDEIMTRLPPKDSYYEVVIKRPLFQAAMSSSISKDDLMGAMLRPKTGGGKPQKPDSRASAAAADTSGDGTAPLNPLLDMQADKGRSRPNAADEPSEQGKAKAQEPAADDAPEHSTLEPDKASVEKSASKDDAPVTSKSPLQRPAKAASKRAPEKKMLDPADLFP